MRKTLTTAAVEKLRPGERRREVPDAGCPGLHLVIQTSGHKSWALRFRRPDGRTAKLTLGPLLSGGEVEGDPVMGQPLTLTAARKVATSVQRERALGQDVIAVHKTEKRRREAEQGSAFGIVARRFIEDHARPKTRSWATSARLLGLSPATLIALPGGLAERWATSPVGEINPLDVHELVSEIRTRGVPGLSTSRRGEVSDAMARVSLARLSKFFTWALGQRLVEKNPCAGVWRPDTGAARERVLSDDEIRWFWEACDSLGWPYGPPLKLMLITGQRRSEVAGMTRGELSVDGATWSLPGSRTKNKRPHAVALPQAARSLMSACPTIDGKAGYIFTTSGRTPASDWSKAKRRLDARMAELAGAPIPPFRLHDLRRTCASGLMRLGVPLPVTERVLNHVSGSFGGIVGVYQRDALLTERADALERWAAHVERIVSGKEAKVVPLGKRAS
jgi:integrase